MARKETQSKRDIYPALEKVPNRFSLILAVAKRARQLKEGAKPLIEQSEKTHPILTALKEVQTEAIYVGFRDSSENQSLEDDVSEYMNTEAIAEEASLGKETNEKNTPDNTDPKSKRKSKSLAA